MFSLWLQNLAAYTLQLTLVIGCGVLVATLLRLRNPVARLALFQRLLLMTLDLPFLQSWNHVIVKSSNVAMATHSGAIESRTLAPKAPPAQSFPLTAMALLAAGMAARSAWVLMGFWTLRQYRQKSTALDPLPPAAAEVQERMAIRAEFRGSGKLTGPITFGLARPLILLREAYLNMAAEAQQAIVCHELIHVRGRDWLFILFEELVLTALWFQPAMWWLIGQIRLAREQAVDAEVIRLTSRRRQYVEAALWTSFASFVRSPYLSRSRSTSEQCRLPSDTGFRSLIR
jgi:beta-lactamase regulating signal transducer with metallopeptidase domain